MSDEFESNEEGDICTDDSTSSDDGEEKNKDSAQKCSAQDWMLC